MQFQEKLDFDEKARIEIWQKLIEVIERHITSIHTTRVSPLLEPQKIRSFLKSFDLDHGADPLEIMDQIENALWENQLHTPHPMYFGLFNPATSVMSIVADTLVALFNPQLAAWSHSPFANEVERFVITEIGKRFGFPEDDIRGSFTTGGNEANFTAVLVALTHVFPDYLSKGIAGIDRQPILYASKESHHSVIRAARTSGLGSDAVRVVPLDKDYKMDTQALKNLIHKDRDTDYHPFLVVATAGTTNAGTIDPLNTIAEIALQENLWLHVDAAWGGAAVFVDELKRKLAGIERADSITFDAHKWFSVPMGAGMFITKHKEILAKTFALSTDYMPKEGKGMDIIDPYTHSIQWSRRFIGLKVFLPLTVAGWDGYSQIIMHQYQMGQLLRTQLQETGWKILNSTELPVICFVHNDDLGKNDLEQVLEQIVGRLLEDGKVWISTTTLGHQQPVLRACITNYRTNENDIQKLGYHLNQARKNIMKN